MLLRELSACEPGQFLLPFDHPHRLGVHCFSVLAGGTGGGPCVDVLVQIDLDTQYASASWGVPLVLRVVPRTGRLPETLWSELRITAGHLTAFTAASRIVFVGHPDPFEYPRGEWDVDNEVYAVAPVFLAGSRLAPRGISGERARTLSYAIVSGSLGDAALGRTVRDELVKRFLSHFNVGTILRISVTQEDHPRWRP